MFRGARGSPLVGRSGSGKIGVKVRAMRFFSFDGAPLSRDDYARRERFFDAVSTAFNSDSGIFHPVDGLIFSNISDQRIPRFRV